MSINWNWTDKIGEWKEERGNKEWTFNIYKCNGLAVWLHEWKEDDKELYQVEGFFADKDHAKNCLGLNKKYSTENIYEDTLKEVKLIHDKVSYELVNLLVKAKFKEPLKITIE